jgi:hypothetical protein
LGWGKSDEGDGRGWTGSSWGAREGGEEALGQRNQSGVLRLGRIPGKIGGGGSVSWGGGSGKATGEKGARSTFIAPHGRRKEEEGRGKIMQPDAERRAVPACLTGRRGGRSGRLPNVEEQGAASAGTAGCGRRDGSTRGASRRGAQSRRTALRAGRRRRRAAEEKQGRKRGR